ncbi:hypothetical protein [Psychrobacillus sp. OK032]|uniref:hypothetical protein n=1 Tax=Psychrobacillus sp. OK032 TaxID=1884358 RepID=UPI0008C81D2E|nr:hypothetical protein [Psychrobacillus sp. OK032]SER87031.1 hypothetical protein SAMN05518872_102416 [Psychrobacillus sp. OK032]
MAILNPKYAFLEADYRNPNLAGSSDQPSENKQTWTIPRLVGVATPTLLLTLPNVAMAASSFDNIYPTLMRMFDSAVVLVIVFAGASWALGHRSKAIELLIGVCCGYLLARNAVNIRDFLKTV